MIAGGQFEQLLRVVAVDPLAVLVPWLGVGVARQQLPAGLKSEYFGGALNTSFALFMIKQDNYAEYDGVRDDGQDAYKAISGTKTKGFEVEISGEVIERLQLLAGYTYTQTKVLEDAAAGSTAARCCWNSTPCSPAGAPACSTPTSTPH